MVRNPDDSISALPNCLQSLVGSTQTLQLDSCTYYDHGSFESFNCNNVLLDGDGCGCVGSYTPHSLPNKDNEVVPIPTLVKHVETTVRTTYADSDSEENVGDDPRERYTVWRQTYTFIFHFYSVSSNSLISDEAKGDETGD